MIRSLLALLAFVAPTVAASDDADVADALRLIQQANEKLAKVGAHVKVDCAEPPAPALPCESSYHTLFLSGAYDGKNIFPDDCVAFVKKVYQTGGDFRSEVLAQATHPLDEEKFSSGRHRDWFYHHTSAPGMTKGFAQAAKDQTLDSFFVKTRLNTAQGGLTWLTSLYIAEDPFSSRRYGENEARMKLAANARTLKPDVPLWKRAFSEEERKHPGLKQACPIMPGYQEAADWPGYDDGSPYYSSIFFVMAEDSGVDLIGYGRGSNDSDNAVCSDGQTGPCGNWYQLLNPLALQSVEASPKGD